jgi:hypothetical protein
MSRYCSYEGDRYRQVIAIRQPAGALLASKVSWLPVRILRFIGNGFLMFTRGDEPNICPLPQNYKC